MSVKWGKWADRKPSATCSTHHKLSWFRVRQSVLTFPCHTLSHPISLFPLQLTLEQIEVNTLKSIAHLVCDFNPSHPFQSLPMQNNFLFHRPLSFIYLYFNSNLARALIWQLNRTPRLYCSFLDNKSSAGGYFLLSGEVIRSFYMERNIWQLHATLSTVTWTVLLDRWCERREGLIILLMYSVTNTSMGTMVIRVRTLIASGSKPISSINYLQSSSENIHPQYSSVHRVYTPSLMGTEPGDICMFWFCVSMMITGFAEHLSEGGQWGLKQRSPVRMSINL